MTETRTKTALERHNAKVNRNPQVVNLVNLIEQYGSEDKCHAYLEALRWPDGIECPKCGGRTISRIEARRQFDCDSCRYQFSVRVGTIFHDSKLPLWKWFLAVYMMCEAKKGVSANQLKRTLGVAYKTAWYLCMRIRAAMKDDDPQPLGADGGVVEVDETYIGGRARSGSKRHLKEGGRKGGTAHLDMVLGALERDGKLRVKVETGRRNAPTLQGFVRDVVDDDASAIYTDQHSAYRSMGEYDDRHAFVDHTMSEWIRGDVSTNGVENAWSLFKRSIVGSYHNLSAKHLDAYLDEFAYRFNNRENPYLFRDTLLALIREEPMTYKELIATPTSQQQVAPSS